jgi:hypothetical protein
MSWAIRELDVPAAENVYDIQVFSAIVRVHKVLVEWEKTGSTGILFAQ